jgi:hypothetical protein
MTIQRGRPFLRTRLQARRHHQHPVALQREGLGDGGWTGGGDGSVGDELGGAGATERAVLDNRWAVLAAGATGSLGHRWTVIREVRGRSGGVGG